MKPTGNRQPRSGERKRSKPLAAGFRGLDRKSRRGQRPSPYQRNELAQARSAHWRSQPFGFQSAALTQVRIYRERKKLHSEATTLPPLTCPVVMLLLRTVTPTVYATLHK